MTENLNRRISIKAEPAPPPLSNPRHLDQGCLLLAASITILPLMALLAWAVR